MIDKIIACKPKSIFDIIPEEMFAFDFATDYLRSGECFEWNYAIAKAIQPKTYLEMGVRFAYSFLPTLLASEQLEFALGLDLETYGNNTVAIENIKKYYHGPAKWSIVNVDTQTLPELPQFYDLITIDACHDYDCKMRDLRLTIGKCTYVVIDDVDYLVDVRKATNDFLKEVGSDGWGKKSQIEWAAYLPTFRGTCLIKYKDAV